MSLIGDIKSIGEVIQKADNIDLYRKILNLQSEAMSVMESLNEKKRKIGSLKKSLKS
jgi:uncharacterized protein YfcZ (UPF0381/DUF406 family)